MANVLTIVRAKKAHAFLAGTSHAAGDLSRWNDAGASETCIVVHASIFEILFLDLVLSLV